MVPRQNKSNTDAKFWKTNKEYYGMFESGLFKRGRGVGNLQLVFWRPPRVESHLCKSEIVFCFLSRLSQLQIEP